MKDFGQRLRRMRKDRKLTHDQLASAIGRTQSSISRYELGRQAPTLAVAVELSRALACTLDELVLGVEPAA